MADTNPGDEDAVTPPIEEEERTETIDDEVRPEGNTEPEPARESDVSARLDALEKELAAMKAMMDTLGYSDPAPSDSDDDDGDGTRVSIEDLFD